MNTRIAPSPTGLFHIGTARTAYLNYLAARSTGGRFILRIDDTDEARNTQENVDIIFSSMEWLGLDYDEVYYQSKRRDRHLEVAKDLEIAGLAVRGESGELRLNLEYKPFEYWTDMIRGDVNVSDADFEFAKKQVLLRADGSPVYNFCSVIDDFDLGTETIIRGKDHISNTGKQEAILWAINQVGRVPDDIAHFNYAHAGLITIGNAKASKRNPDHAAIVSIQAYKDKDINPDAMLNFLLRMGWGPKVDDKSTAIITRERALELFLDGGNMKSNDAKFDMDRLLSYDRKYKGMLRSTVKA